MPAPPRAGYPLGVTSDANGALVAGVRALLGCALGAVLGGPGCGARTELLGARPRNDAAAPDASTPDASDDGSTGNTDATLPDALGAPDVSPADATSCDGGLVACATGCTDTRVDPDNCGRCGHGCCSGTCSAGVCQPVAVAVATGEDSPVGITASDSHVYWTVIGNGGGPGSVMRAPVGGGPPTALATDQTSPDAIAIDATSVYFVDNGVGVMSVPLAGGTVTVLASGPYGAAFGGLVVDPATVYWADQGGALLTVPIGGGPVTTLVPATAHQLGALAIDATSLYWTIEGMHADNGSVMKMPLAGGPATALVTMLASPQAIAVDGASVYFNDYTSGTVSRVPLGGGAVAILASGQTVPDGIAVDARFVYWADDANTVMAVPIGGGQAIALASGVPDTVGVALSRNCVYWTSPQGGTVSVVAKP
jgi:hypothetical protein